MILYCKMLLYIFTYYILPYSVLLEDIPFVYTRFCFNSTIPGSGRPFTLSCSLSHPADEAGIEGSSQGAAPLLEEAVQVP